MTSELEFFCQQLTAKYKISQSEALDLMQNERYTMKDAKDQRAADEYVQALIRHSKYCGMGIQVTLTQAWKNLDSELQRNIRRPTEMNYSG